MVDGGSVAARTYSMLCCDNRDTIFANFDCFGEILANSRVILVLCEYHVQICIRIDAIFRWKQSRLRTHGNWREAFVSKFW